MAIMMDAGILSYLTNLLKKGGRSTLELDGRICYVEVQGDKIAFTPTNKTRETHNGTIEHWNGFGDKVKPAPKKPAPKKRTAAKKKPAAKRKPAAKKKK